MTMELPSLPAQYSTLIPHLNRSSSQQELFSAIQPYIDHETKLRQLYAQQPQHEAVNASYLVPVFGDEPLTVRARDLSTESSSDKERYLLTLPDSKRLKHGSLATVSNIAAFKTNFNLFTEQSLVDLDWSNVVAAGSSVVTPLLPVDKPHNENKRSLRAYYHEQLAPASDVDLFIYGLTEDQAIEKIRQIETSIRNSILAETTTIRTKNTITIVSEYPVRHVQIVLRLYKSISEILTGFDVDCSGVAYDGQQVWASPRALAAFATQQNRIDLTRRSPSYENRLSKYSHRGFEVYWPLIDRSRIDPTIFERSFNRVAGLARLLVLEKLPHPSDRDSYADKRRKERGRPDLPWNSRYRHALPGNVKDSQPDDVPDWLEDATHSEYQTFTIPYGPKYNAKRIEKLLFRQDLLLNAEWNKPKDRLTNLHRHPAFFGTVEDVIHDCCGFCPEPTTDEDLKAHEEESSRYISGDLTFMKDNPGRQTIGSFHPLNDDDWTDMAYLGSSTKLCQAIVDMDVEAVKDWFGEAAADVNRRDHTGRTPLQLACMSSTPEIVQILIERGARIVSRIYSGMTALHMAASRGNTEIVRLLLDKSASNEENESRKEDVRKEARRAAITQNQDDEVSQAEDVEMIDEDEESDDDVMTQGSFVKVEGEKETEEENEDEPDFYHIDVLAWDNPLSPLHLAIINGHVPVIQMLIERYSADVMLPVKLKEQHQRASVILTLVLPMQLPLDKAIDTIATLLSHGASPAQADSNQISALHYLINEAKTEIIDILSNVDRESTRKLINHLAVSGYQWNANIGSPLFSAIKKGSPEMIQKLLELGVKPEIDFETFARAYSNMYEDIDKNPDALKKIHQENLEQPVIQAARNYLLADVIAEMIDKGANVNTLSAAGYKLLSSQQHHNDHSVKSLLDMVQDQIDALVKYDGGNDQIVKKPDPLPPFTDTGVDGYQSWLLRTNYKQAENLHVEHMEQYEKDVKLATNLDTAGREEKQRIIAEILDKWRSLKNKMVDKGAKTFFALHSDINVDKTQRHVYNYQLGKSGLNKDRPFENKISFRVAALTDAKRLRYLDLFEAIYNNDEATVKSLCLNTENPLQIAVQDSANFSPFSLAVLRGHYGLARTVLNIAATQYQPSKEEGQTYRYSLRQPDEEDYEDDYHDDGDDESGDEDPLYAELVDDVYTIDDIRTLSENTKSRVSPTQLFQMPCELWRTSLLDEPKAKAHFGPQDPPRHFYPQFADEREPNGWLWTMLDRERDRNTFSLFRHAIVQNDQSMIKFLLRMQTDLLYDENKTGTLQNIQISVNDFDVALRLGRTEIISEIIRNTGTLLPLANLAEKSGVQDDDKTEFYQGLSVYGKKRKDWAQQDQNGRQTTQALPANGSPLLFAIFSGNLAAVEYFLSETPLRCYEEFAESFVNDKQIQSLVKSKDGIAGALRSWMDTRSHLAIHMAVIADRSISKPVREFLIHRMPQYIDAKSSDGTTPLQLAFIQQHFEAAKELIEAGADQYTRDKDRANILHKIYTSPYATRPGELKKAVGLLDPVIARSLTLQRLSTENGVDPTPLMAFLNGNSNTENINDILDDMMEISGGKDLDVIDGAGDYPLHALVRSKNTMAGPVEYLVKRRPKLLYKENATGMTPLEVVENAFLRSLIDSPPSVEMQSSYASMYHNSGMRPLIEIPPQEFVEASFLKPQGKYTQVRDLYEALKDFAAKHPNPRNLVSVLEANETARRLAIQQQKQNEIMKQREAAGRVSYGSRRRYYYNMQRSRTEGLDEVSMWQNKLTPVFPKDDESS